MAVAALLIQYLLLHKPLAGSVPRDINPVDVAFIQWVRSGLRYLGFGVHSLDHTDQEDGLRAAFDQVNYCLLRTEKSHLHHDAGI